MKDRLEELLSIKNENSIQDEDARSDTGSKPEVEVEIEIDEIEKERNIEIERENFISENELENEIVLFLVDIVLMDENINSISKRYGLHN